MMLKFSSSGMCWLHGGEMKEVCIASLLKNYIFVIYIAIAIASKLPVLFKMINCQSDPPTIEMITRTVANSFIAPLLALWLLYNLHNKFMVVQTHCNV